MPSRSEFRVWHEEDECYYIMFDKVGDFARPGKRCLRLE